MIEMSVVAVAIALAIGLGTRWLLAHRDSRRYNGWGRWISNRITWSEYVVVGILLSTLVAPLASTVGTNLSIGEQLQYKQWLNGVERNAGDNVRQCRAGQNIPSSETAGYTNCEYYYVAEWYTYQWIDWVEDCSTDSKGKRTCTRRAVTRSKKVPVQTPYATVEHTYSIESWMYDGDGGQMSYAYPGTYLDANPVPHPASRRDIPGNIPRGAPADWQDAKNRLDAGDPRAVTKEGTYDNFILASKDDLLRTYGPKLDEYKADGLLPDHTANITTDPVKGPSRSQADKVSFVGVNVQDENAWQKSVMRFNAALGTQLQGDLHVVLIDAAIVPWSDAVPYTQSLKAYWQSEHFGRWAIAKNAIILVMGVDKATNTVAWADATTGMPFGNETMIEFLKAYLPGTPLVPDLLFGKPVTVVDGTKANVTHPAPQGKVEHYVFEQAPFKRFSMSCKKESCIGYKDLASKIKPTTTAIVWVSIITVLISIGLWVLVGYTSFVENGISWCRQNLLPHRYQGARSGGNDNRKEYPDGVRKLR